MIQEYDFDIEHVAEEENNIADEVLAHDNVIKYVPVKKYVIIS
jgi:hypothetical protein